MVFVFCIFFLGESLFRMTLKHSAEALPFVPKHSKAVVCLMKKVWMTEKPLIQHTLFCWLCEFGVDESTVTKVSIFTPEPEKQHYILIGVTEAHRKLTPYLQRVVVQCWLVQCSRDFRVLDCKHQPTACISPHISITSHVYAAPAEDCC